MYKGYPWNHDGNNLRTKNYINTFKLHATSFLSKPYVTHWHHSISTTETLQEKSWGRQEIQLVCIFVISASCLFVQLSVFFTFRREEVLVVLWSISCFTLLHHPGNVAHPVTELRAAGPRFSIADIVEVVHQTELDDDWSRIQLK